MLVYHIHHGVMAPFGARDRAGGGLPLLSLVARFEIAAIIGIAIAIGTGFEASAEFSIKTGRLFVCLYAFFYLS